MSEKEVRKRTEEVLNGKTQFDPSRKKGIGEIHPWNPSESSKLLPLRVKKSKK
jgi:hypothetical protein